MVDWSEPLFCEGGEIKSVRKMPEHHPLYRDGGSWLIEFSVDPKTQKYGAVRYYRDSGEHFYGKLPPVTNGRKLNSLKHIGLID